MLGYIETIQASEQTGAERCFFINQDYKDAHRG